jgi:hypothetical protein
MFEIAAEILPIAFAMLSFVSLAVILAMTFD